jgi:signal transduction histidine kinase
MQQQVEDLLDVGRLQQGTFSLKPAECGARDLFREVDLLLRPLAVSADIELVVEPLPGCSASQQVRVDAARLQQVIANLVGNALKFTPPGGRVAVGWWVGEAGLSVNVSDTGPGIPKEQLPHIFGAFWQARDGDRRGVGLGLWIARSIVEAHGGRIWVDSVPGQGATFHFAVPLDVPSQSSDPEADSMGRLTHAPQSPAV